MQRDWNQFSLLNSRQQQDFLHRELPSGLRPQEIHAGSELYRGDRHLMLPGRQRAWKDPGDLLVHEIIEAQASPSRAAPR